MGTDDGRRTTARRFSWLPCLLLVVLLIMVAAWVMAMGLVVHVSSNTVPTNKNAIVLRNEAGIEVHILPTGAAIQRLLLPDRDGVVDDVVLGFDDERHYADGTSPYFGAVVGRVANRIANASFELDGVRYQLSVNEKGFPGSLHGGKRGFDKVVWEATRIKPHALKHRRRGDAVRLRYKSPHGEEGYPGNLDAEVVYTLTASGELMQSITAVTDRPTIVNLAQHSYFNLGGHNSGTILNHTLRLRATHRLPIDARRIPTGQLAPVRGTPFDFTAATPICSHIDQVDGPGWAAGYDHCFVLHGRGPAATRRADTAWWAGKPRLAATLHDPASGRAMQILTTAPGLQLYTSNFLDGSISGKSGTRYFKYAGVCLETQSFPDGIHHQPSADPDHTHFPTGILRPGDVYRHTTIYRFSVRSTGAGGADEEDALDEPVGHS